MRLHISMVLLISFFLITCKNENKVDKSPKYKLSLAEWSLHKTLFDHKMTNLDFPAQAKSLGFEGVEYVNQFFKDKAEDVGYLDSLNNAASAAGITNVLIMIDGEGSLGDADTIKRDSAVDNHKKWVLAAKHLGCHSIRVNAHGEGSAEDVSKNAIKGLTALSDFAKEHGINVIVENHGGYSSDGQWLSKVISSVNRPNCGTLPDFGNFCLKREDGAMWGSKCLEEYDRYKGIEEMMPFARGVSAKSYDFNDEGEETTIDYGKMIDIVKKANYTGFIGVEYEGERLGEIEGIGKTRELLVKKLK